MPPIVIGLGNSADTSEFKDPLGLYGGGGLNPKAAESRTRPVNTQTRAVSTQELPSRVVNKNSSFDQKDWNDMVDTVIAEASADGPQGMTAVASVIKNRAAARGISPGDVVRQPSQFEGYESPREGSRKAQQDPAIRSEAEKIVQGVFDGTLQDPTGGADHFHADYVSPDWAKTMPPTTKIGGHTFYSSKGKPKAAETASGIAIGENFEVKDGLGLYGGNDPFAAVDKETAARAAAEQSGSHVPNPSAKGLARLVRPEEPDMTAATAFLETRLRGHTAEHITGMVPELRTGLAALFQAAPPEIADGLEVFSGARSIARQKKLFADAVEKYGSVAAARKWVAPPPGEYGSKGSRHNHGQAGELSWNGMRLDQAPEHVRAWVHENAPKYGLAFPLGHEPWHIETANARGGKAAAAQPVAKPASDGIVMSGDFQPKNDMKLYGDDNPFKVASAPSKLRPFQPGEQRPNPDGSYSTEISTTWQLPSGEWVNVPSLWMGENRPVQFDPGDEDGILGAMQEYEKTNGPTFERFKSPADAEAAAKARSEAGGSAAGTAVDQTLETLNTENPGRYTTIDEAELPAWQQQWEAENRSGGRGGDLARKLGAGNADLGLAVRSAVGVIPKIGPSIVRGLDAVDEWFTGVPVEQRLENYAATARGSATEAAQVSYNKTWWDSENGTFGPAWSDPDSYLGAIAESTPGMLATMGPGALMARGAYTAAIAKGVGSRAAAAAAARTALISGAVSEGALGGGQAARSVEERISEIPREELLQSDAAKALLSQGMSADEAVNALIRDGATKAFVVAGVATGAFGGLGDRALAKIIAEGLGGTIAKRILSGSTRGAVAEGVLEELPQSVAQTAAENLRPIGTRRRNACCARPRSARLPA